MQQRLCGNEILRVIYCYVMAHKHMIGCVFHELTAKGR